MVIITDGGIGEISGMRQSIKSLKDKGVNFVALGVGPLREVKTLETITQYEDDNSRVFLVKRFDNMKQYSQDISDAACFARMTYKSYLYLVRDLNLFHLGESSISLDPKNLEILYHK